MCQGSIIADYQKSAMFVASQRGDNGVIPDSHLADPNFAPRNMRINGIN